MTYWGAPSPGGSKFYLGSSGDTAWNHDILWKARVEKEVAELDPAAEELQELSDDKYLAGVSDRTWERHELDKLQDAIRVHGAGNFHAILNNPIFSSLRNHSEQALKEQWRSMEYMRSKSLGNTTSAWRKKTMSQKRALVSRQRQYDAKQKQMSYATKSPNDIRMSWRGTGNYNPNQSLKSKSTSKLPQLPMSPMQKMANSVNKNKDLKARSYVFHLKDTLRKETMVRDNLKRTLGEQQKQRDSTHLDLLQERKMRRQAENALRKYQRVLSSLAMQRGIVAEPMKGSASSPLLNATQKITKKSKSRRNSERREQLKTMLMSAEMGSSSGLLNTKSRGFF